MASNIQQLYDCIYSEIGASAMLGSFFNGIYSYSTDHFSLLWFFLLKTKTSSSIKMKTLFRNYINGSILIQLMFSLRNWKLDFNVIERFFFKTDKTCDPLKKAAIDTDKYDRNSVLHAAVSLSEMCMIVFNLSNV